MYRLWCDGLRAIRASLAPESVTEASAELLELLDAVFSACDVDLTRTLDSDEISRALHMIGVNLHGERIDLPSICQVRNLYLSIYLYPHP